METKEDRLRRAAEAGDRDATYALAVMLYQASRRDEAYIWCRIAANAGHPQAEAWLWHGQTPNGGSPPDPDTLVGRVAISQNGTDTVILDPIKITDTDPSQAPGATGEGGQLVAGGQFAQRVAALQTEINEAESDAAMFTLGTLYEQAGRYGEAERWYSEAFHAGHADAMFARSRVQTVLWQLDRAKQEVLTRAEAGDGQAAIDLARVLVQTGELHEAAQWLRRAADARHPKAGYCLGVLHLHVNRPQEALPWFEYGGEQGDADAADHAASLYDRLGKGAQAKRWRKRAAKLRA